MSTVAVMGSTGSIGVQTLEVIAASDGRFQVDSLSAHHNVELVAAQAQAMRPRVVALADPSRAAELAAALPHGVELVVGEDAAASVCGEADIVVNGVVGFAGLTVTMAALAAGRRLALANKESLIAAGPIVQPLRNTPGAEIIPVDSEHCAIHQCLRSGVDTVPREGPGGSVGDGGRLSTRSVSSLVLTASGGPFRGRSAAELRSVTVADALAHPTWSMGPKITVDSSTLVNKGLEVIEAHELFGVPYDDIEVVVHPSSIVHSMVSFSDGATIAQLSCPDMRLPISYALAWPDRHDVAFGAMDFSQPLDLHFEPPDLEAFPSLRLAFEVGRAGGTCPAWFSAANEVAVEAFLAGQIGWSEIAAVNQEAVARWDGGAAVELDDVLMADAHGRAQAADVIRTRERAA